MTTEAAIAKLRQIEPTHIKFASEMIRAADGALYPMDLLAAAVLKRSVCLLVAFCDLIEKRNFVAGAPLLRLQLDNVLRFQGAWLVSKPHDFAIDVLKGKHIRNMRDRHGQKMTDKYLLSKIADQYPMLESVYEHLSGYIHLSEKHIFNTLKAEGDDGRFGIVIGPTDNYISEQTYLEALVGFYKVTEILFRYLQGWLDAKSGKAPKGAPPLQ